ncbi:MAG: AraC family ligand binding domain-containing protein [Clostridia bacterium]|nr:AraC family ligand binding domain-containing protein [Clostridia bacterium]
MEQMGLSKDGADRAKMFIRHFSAEEVFEAPKLARGFVEANYSKGLHTQGFYEVNTVLRGSAVHCVGKRSITVSCGDTFIIPPNVPHSYDGGEGFDVYHLLLSPKFLERNFSELRLLPAFSALFRIDPMLREKTSSRLHFRLDGSELDFLSPMLDTLTRYSAQKSTESAIITNCQAMIVVAELCSAYDKRMQTEH